MSNYRDLCAIVAHDAAYFVAALSILLGGLAFLLALEMSLFVVVMFAISLLPVLVSTAVHFGKDISEMNHRFKA